MTTSRTAGELHALIVDDSRAMRGILKRILLSAGFSAIGEAANGREGLEWLGKEETPDIVLLDWNMPEMNGLEMLRQLRADERFAALSVMMVTTEIELEHVEQALLAGANEYIMKPFTPEAIAEKLELLGLPVGTD